MNAFFPGTWVCSANFKYFLLIDASTILAESFGFTLERNHVTFMFCQKLQLDWFKICTKDKCGSLERCAWLSRVTSPYRRMLCDPLVCIPTSMSRLDDRD